VKRAAFGFLLNLFLLTGVGWVIEVDTQVQTIVYAR
jgi:hypothetical protein